MNEWPINLDLNVVAAWWGALVATLVAIREFRKRPKIQIGMSQSVIRDQRNKYLKDADGNPISFLRVEISNIGDKPTSLNAVVVEQPPPSEMCGKMTDSTIEPNEHPCTPIFLSPGATCTFRYDLKRLNHLERLEDATVVCRFSHLKEPIRRPVEIPE